MNWKNRDDVPYWIPLGIMATAIVLFVGMRFS